MAQQTLLEKAKQIPKKNSSGLTKQELELAVAWANNEVDLNQVRKAINSTSSKLYVFLAYALKNYINSNTISIQLPSDEEIFEYWEENGAKWMKNIDEYYRDGAIAGAKWMKGLIQKK